QFSHRSGCLHVPGSFRLVPGRANHCSDLPLSTSTSHPYRPLIMTNPYHYNPPDFHGNPSGMPTGLPGFGQRRRYYVPLATGPAGFPRASDFANILNPSGDSADIHAYSASNHDSDASRNGSEQNGTASRLPGYRNPQLPTFSRAFEPFLRTDGPASIG